MHLQVLVEQNAIALRAAQDKEKDRKQTESTEMIRRLQAELREVRAKAAEESRRAAFAEHRLQVFKCIFL